jgi:hypothetical protein
MWKMAGGIPATVDPPHLESDPKAVDIVATLIETTDLNRNDLGALA